VNCKFRKEMHFELAFRALIFRYSVSPSGKVKKEYQKLVLPQLKLSLVISVYFYV